MNKNGGNSREGARRGGNLRGQSETLGIVLVFAIVIAGATLVVAIGATAIGDSEDELSDQRAEKAMTQFASKAGLVALEESDSQTVDFATGQSEQYFVNEDDGWMAVTIENKTTGNKPSWANPSLLNTTLGSMTYERGDTVIGYQGGGVFRTTQNGGQMISPPEFHYREGTLVLPLINVTGDASVGSSATVTRSRVTKEFPTANTDRTNPLDNHIVRITVKSEYYRGWGSFFEERTDGEVKYKPSKNIAIITLLTPLGELSVANAIKATSGSGKLVLKGTGTTPARTDSYNSSVDEYSISKDENGNISHGGDVDIGGNAAVDGNILADGWIKCQGSANVNGFLHYGDAVTSDIKCTPTDGHKAVTEDPVVSPALNFRIESVVNTTENNGNTSVSPDSNIDSSDRYYFDRIELNSGEQLEIDTEGNRVVIAVDEYVSLEDSAEIFVKGDGRVEVYINGSATSPDGNNLELLKGSSNSPTITTSGPIENATNFWVFGKDNMKAELEGTNSDFAQMEGVIFAPTGDSGTQSSEIIIKKGEIFGAMTAGDVIVKQGDGGEIHFDEALKQAQVLPPNTKIPIITFIHTTVNTVNIGE